MMGLFKRFLRIDKGDITMDSEVKEVLGFEPGEYHKDDYNASEMEVI